MWAFRKLQEHIVHLFPSSYHFSFKFPVWLRADLDWFIVAVESVSNVEHQLHLDSLGSKFSMESIRDSPKTAGLVQGVPVFQWLVLSTKSFLWTDTGSWVSETHVMTHMIQWFSFISLIHSFSPYKRLIWWFYLFFLYDSLNLMWFFLRDSFNLI